MSYFPQQCKFYNTAISVTISVTIITTIIIYKCY